MRLQRIHLKQIRRFRTSLVIDQLEPGINVLAGPNESGKSTIVRALRAAFFERHRSSSATTLQPWNDSSAAPGVELTFEWEQAHWRLTKQFLHQRRCDLLISPKDSATVPQSFSADEAEEHIAQWLGYQMPLKGASKAEHWGIPGLLWIEQGTGHEVHDAVNHARDHLRSALGARAAEVASSSGDALIARVQDERNRWLTASGKPRADYAQLIKDHEACEQRILELEQETARYRTLVDQLALLRQEQRNDAETPWVKFAQQARDTEIQLTQVQGWMREQEASQQALAGCKAQQTLCRDQLHAMAQQHNALKERTSARDQAQAHLTTLLTQETAYKAQQKQAQARFDAARVQLQAAREHAQWLQLEKDYTQVCQELSTLHSQLLKAQELQAQTTTLKYELQTLQVDPVQLARLEQLTRTLHDLSAQQQALATRLTFNLLPDQALTLTHDADTLSAARAAAQHVCATDAENLTVAASDHAASGTVRITAGQTEHLLSQAATLAMPGLGTLRVEPGGSDIAELHRQYQTTLDAINALLTHMGVKDLQEAKERADRCTTVQHTLNHYAAQLDVLAPKGVSELEQRTELLRQQRQHISEQCLPLRARLAVAPTTTETTAVAADASAHYPPSLQGAEAVIEACLPHVEDTPAHDGHIATHSNAAVSVGASAHASAGDGTSESVHVHAEAGAGETLLTELSIRSNTISQEQAEIELEAARDALTQAEQQLSGFTHAVSMARQALETAHKEWDRIHTELNAPERSAHEHLLRSQLIQLQAEQQALEHTTAERDLQIQAANPQVLAQTIERLSRTAQSLESAARERAHELTRLQTQLDTLGASGLEEQLAEQRLQREYLARRLDETRRRAEALDLLLSTLTEQRQELTLRLQAPLQRHMNKYVRLLFPQAQLHVNEELAPSHLTRTSHSGQGQDTDPFSDLSYGAREQMSLISRLAYADLLKESGRPTLIILDDALVHSDHHRLEPMKRALFDAAQRHQILLFTCHHEDWQDMGVRVRDIRSLTEVSNA